MNTFLDTVLSLFYPRRCPVCDGPVKPWNALICRECRPALTYSKPPRCMKCGKQIGDEEKEYCADCAGRAHFYDRGRALFAYSSVSDSIARFKYHGRREYAAFYAACMAERLGDFISACEADAFVPVPLHKSRKQKRGYNSGGGLGEGTFSPHGNTSMWQFDRKSEKNSAYERIICHGETK